MRYVKMLRIRIFDSDRIVMYILQVVPPLHIITDIHVHIVSIDVHVH